MDTNALTVFKLFVVGIFVNNLMTSGLSATENINVVYTHRPRVPCNETRLLLGVEMCGEGFKREMARVDPQQWCNLTHFISDYHHFTVCTENTSEGMGCFWPNPLVESYIIRIHTRFFSNCTLARVIWVDPPDYTLAVLIVIPVFLTLAMIALVVWCSKRSDILA